MAQYEIELAQGNPNHVSVNACNYTEAAQYYLNILQQHCDLQLKLVDEKGTETYKHPTFMIKGAQKTKYFDVVVENKIYEDEKDAFFNRYKGLFPKYDKFTSDLYKGTPYKFTEYEGYIYCFNPDVQFSSGLLQYRATTEEFKKGRWRLQDFYEHPYEDLNKYGLSLFIDNLKISTNEEIQETIYNGFINSDYHSWWRWLKEYNLIPTSILCGLSGYFRPCDLYGMNEEFLLAINSIGLGYVVSHNLTTLAYIDDSGLLSREEVLDRVYEETPDCRIMLKDEMCVYGFVI